MDDPTKASYAYDPFQKEGRDRWGRKTKEKIPPPEIPNYDIIDFLGEGGMASVWSAKYRPLNQPRAVKVLSQAVAIDMAFLERFAEEAKALARLEHPNIVKVYDASTDIKTPYLAMDFVAGKTLSDVLKARNLSQDEALKYFGNIADALDYAHGMGFVHRDIKPSNVMIANTGKAMLIDFGVASWLGGVGEKANTITGTTRYMSPEACRGDRVTMASDLWAFGVLMYRTLTGSMPFDGKSEQEIMHAIQNLPPKEPNHPNAKVRAFLKKVLAKSPDERPKSAGAMANEYARAVRPFVFKRHREGLAVGASILLVGLVLLSLVGGVVGYVMTRKGNKEVVYVGRGGKSGAGDSTSSAKSGGVDTAGGVGVQAVSGVWYASFENQWAEIKLDPTSGQKFHATFTRRNSSGPVVIDAEGELKGSKISLHEASSSDGSSSKSPSAAFFTGEVNEDHSRITGKLALSGGKTESGEWVRSSGLSSSPQQNSQIGFSVPTPNGWQANTGDSTTISPIGRSDVFFSVISAPLNGSQSILDVFKVREDALAVVNDKGGSYNNMGTNNGASFGGVTAASWDLTYQEQGGTKMRAKIFGVLRGDSSVMVESWWPVAEEDIWSPILDNMRQNFKFSN